MATLVSARRALLVLGLATAGAMATAVTASAAAQPATGDIQAAGGATAIGNSYIVTLRDGVSNVDAAAHRLANRYGGTIRQTYDTALHGIEVSIGEKAARRLAADRAVSVVEQNHTISLAATQANPPSWGLDRIDQRNLPLDRSYTFPNTASNVHAYIIDTGIRFSHRTFGGRATSGFDAIDGGRADDCNGHGTHVAGTVGGAEFGVAKRVQLVAVRVLDCRGGGSVGSVVAGINWVTRNAIKPAVANMSLGGGPSASIDAAVNRSISAGVTYAIAAGNSNANACNFSPARVPAAITVGATDRTDRRASFSNFGRCLDIFGPGVAIVSSVNTSDTATASFSGTSMATPHVTGAAALVLQAHPGFTPTLELHLHLEGSIRPATLLEIAGRNGEALPADTVEGLTRLYEFTDFRHFIEVWVLTTNCLRTAEDFRRVVVDYAAEAASFGAVYVEGIFSPCERVQRGVGWQEIFEGYTDGAIAAAEEHGVTVRFTPDLYRGVPVELAEECARMAVRYRERGVVGLGLGGIEGARPVSEYAKAFAIARDGGLAAVPHAGEAAGAASVWEALSLDPVRIRHGIRAEIGRASCRER